jgi:hypothetical protein
MEDNSLFYFILFIFVVVVAFTFVFTFFFFSFFFILLAKHNRKVQILRAWHGTSGGMAKKILKSGFANLAKMDDGWFGKGIYFSTNPEYH